MLSIMDNMGLFKFGFFLAVFTASVCLLPSADGACSCQNNVGYIANAFAQIGSGDYCCYSTGTGIRTAYCCEFSAFVENSTGLTIGAIVGIAIGCLVAVVLAIVLLCCCCGCCCFG